MQIVKRNLFSICCGVVALLAFIAWFWPVGGWYDDFQEALKKRVAVNTQIQTLSKRPRMVPPVGASGVSEPLAHFPNPATITAVDGATKGLKQNSDQTLSFVVEMNRAGHDLLEPGSLPAPIDSYRFRSQYNAVMDYGGKPEPWDRRNPDAGPYNLLDQVLNATPAATKQEIDDALKKKWETDYLPKVFTVNGQQVNLADIQLQFDQDTADFVKVFHQDRSSRFKIYCDNTHDEALTRAPRLTPTDTPSATDIWFAQMTLWVEQDVCQTIREMNKDVQLQKGEGIAQSPVKNLINVKIDPDMRMYVVGQQIAITPGAPPPPELDPSLKKFDISPTGRVCNSLYDVVSFNVTVVLLPSHLQEFLERLRYSRLLTVTSMSVHDVDWKAAEELGYIYGPSRCVQVSLDCEELFMRDWTARQIVQDPNHPAPMPVEVQKLLGITPQVPAAGPTPARVALQ